ncbi:MAG: hypothetical protein JWN70_6774 [Planctomycetaceae bacterium]|nr:hypothetical protein [Planctomycetaceae bacterium]
MPIPVECKTCGAQLKVKEQYAGTLARCPKCKMGISIPMLPPQADADEEIDNLDFEPRAPAPQKIAKRKQIPAKAPAEVEDELEFLDPDDEALLKLPPARKKKKKTTLRKMESAPVSPGGRGDVLVWVFLLAILPLGVISVLPQKPIAERVEKMVEKNQELQAELEEYGAQDFMAMNKDLTLEGAHLSRKSMVHWAYACFAAAGFLALMNAMRHMTTVTAQGLFLTGVLTGTVGIGMLLTFQVLAEISLHIRVFGGGIFGLIMLAIKFIGFSYRAALDPNSGFLWSFVGFTCGVGFCEEVCKAIPVFYYLRNTRSSDWRGTCLLGFASGAGFGISEGIMYAGSYYNGIEPATAYIVRFVSCVAFHAILSGGVALLMFGNQDYIDGDNDWITFLWGGMTYIMIAMVLHGLYDTLLKQRLDPVAFIVALAAFGWLAWLSRYYWDYEPPPKYEGGVIY